MARWHRLSMIVLVLLVVWGVSNSSPLEGQVVNGKGQPRFTKDKDGVISDSATGLEWYVGPAGFNWYEAKFWAESLTVAGGGWRMPTLAELKAIYKEMPPRAGIPQHFDPIFQTNAAHVWSGERRWVESSNTYFAAICTEYAPNMEMWSRADKSFKMGIVGWYAFAVRSRR